jgi:hypothetical protein
MGPRLSHALPCTQGLQWQYLLLDTNPRVSRVPRPQLLAVAGDINLALATPFGAPKRCEDICSGPLSNWR